MQDQTPVSKMSKKKQKAHNARQRNTWPVGTERARVTKNKKAYTRKGREKVSPGP